MNPNESMEEKLKRLGVFLGVGKIQPAARVEHHHIEDVIDTHEVESPWGNILVHEEIYPAGYGCYREIAQKPPWNCSVVGYQS